MDKRTLTAATVVVFLVVVSGVIGGVAATAMQDQSQDQVGDDPEEVTREVVFHTGTANSTTYKHAYDELMDSVVSIRVVTDAGGTSQGSGFVYDTEGHIVTNHHVISGADTVQVLFRGGEWREAEFVGSDVYSDLAVIRVEDVPEYADDLDVAETNPQPGEVVMALGNPFGLEESITHGIVSGANRTMDTAGGFSIPATVQTDAAINPGNSGGPLVGTGGTVVGVSRAKRGDNIGFAISPEILNRVVPSLTSDGEYTHSYIGVSMKKVTPTIAKAMDLERAEGVLIEDVAEGGPSDGRLRGGDAVFRLPSGTAVLGGDVVTAIDGREVGSPGGISSYLATETRPGDTVEVTAVRDGEEVTVEVTLGERPDPRLGFR